MSTGQGPSPAIPKASHRCWKRIASGYAARIAFVTLGRFVVGLDDIQAGRAIGFDDETGAVVQPKDRCAVGFAMRPGMRPNHVLVESANVVCPMLLDALVDEQINPALLVDGQRSCPPRFWNALRRTAREAAACGSTRPVCRD